VPRRYGARRALQRGGQRCAHPVRSPTGIPGGRRGLVRPELGADGLGGGAGQGGRAYVGAPLSATSIAVKTTLTSSSP